MARQTSFNEDSFEAVLNTIATSNLSNEKACEKHGVAVRTFHAWIARDEKLRQRYASAKQEQAQMLVDEIVSISDERSGDTLTKVNRDRLRVDTRKWLASKLFPKMYGDKVELGGELDVAVKGITSIRVVHTKK